MRVMGLIDQSAKPLEEWRDGVVTRMRISAVNGAHQLCVFDQWCDPGCSVPLHSHAVEELLEVVEGKAEVICGGEMYIAVPDQSVLIPAGCLHGFRNVGDGKLHMRAILAAPIFEASYQNGSGVSHRWEPDAQQ